MTWLTDKPAVTVALPYMAGLTLAWYVEIPLWPLFVALGLLLLGALLLFAKPIFSQIMLLLIVTLCAVLQLELCTHNKPANHISEFGDLPYIVTVEGVVCGPVSPNGEGVTTIIRADSVWVRERVYATQGKCLLQIYEKHPNLHYGHRVVARGQLRLPAGERNPGDFDYRKYLAAQNIHAVMRANKAAHVLVLNEGEGNPLLLRFVYPAYEYVVSCVDKTMSGQIAALLKALLIGVRSDLDDDVQQAFSDVGVIHVLAVSGSHVGFVLVCLLGLFGILRFPDPWRTAAIILCLIFYAFLTGMQPAVFRATVMAIIFLIGRLVQRRTHVLNTLAAAALVVLVVSPLNLFEPGFQLSFVAVLGMALLYDRLRFLFLPLTRKWRESGANALVWLVELFAVSAAAQLATLPMTVYYFSRLSLVAFVANLIVVPAVAVIMAIGMVGVLFALIWPWLGSLYLDAAWLLLSGLVVLVKAAQNLPLAFLVLPRPSFLVIALYVSSLALFLLWRQKRARFVLLAAMLVLLNVQVWTSLFESETPLKITFFDVGQGDAALLEFPNDRTMLIDAGDRTDYVDYGKRIIYPYLVRNGIKRIDQLVLTHAHADHNGGALYLLEQRCVGRIIKTHCQENEELDVKIDSLAVANCLPVRHVLAGDTLLVHPEVCLLVLSPTASFVQQAKQNAAELNDASIVLKCVYHDFSILMTGDAEQPAEKTMLLYDSLLTSNVIKIAHHGSATASGDKFRQAVHADYGVVSVAAFNRFGLPSEPLLQKYSREGTTILRTSREGAIQFLVYNDKIERRR